MFIAPIVEKVILENRDRKRLLVPGNWGLLPAASKNADIPRRYARAESLLDNPLCRDLLAIGRCLLMMRGYSEYPHRAGRPGNERFWINTVEDEISGIAGLYRVHTSEDGAMTVSCCMITTPAAPSVRFLNHRMPAILRGEVEEALWLSRDERDLGKILPLLRPYQGGLNVSVAEKNGVESTSADAIASAMLLLGGDIEEID